MTADKIIQTAVSQIGVTESPANSNLQKYGQAYGYNGVPWCVIFVWWVFNTAGAPELFFDGGKTASCSQYIAWAKSAGQWITSGYRPGDIVFFDFDSTPDADHVGIIERVTDTALITIEGNTSASGSQDNGGAVLRKERAYKYVYGAARPAYTQQTKPVVKPQEDENMTQAEFNKMFKTAMDEFLKEQKTQDIPDWAKEDGEYAKAVECGITDGTNPCVFIPRYQAAIMAYRAKEGK